MWPLWPGQSRDHFAMNVAISLLRCASTLVKVLNSAALSADGQRLVERDRRFDDARAGLLVQPLDAEVHRLAGRRAAGDRSPLPTLLRITE